MRLFARSLTRLWVLVLLLAPATFAPADAKVFKYAFQGDLNSLDPHTLNESFTLGALGNVYEGLTKRDSDLKIIPGLAERWEQLEPTRWRFHLRKGVTFHDGQAFSADDVIFTLNRMRTPAVTMRNKVDASMTMTRIDDHTVDMVTARPNPILHYEFDTVFILSKAWAEANGALTAQTQTATSLNTFALRANGTGPFRVISHEPGVKTVYRPNPTWWGKPAHNLTEVIFQTIKSDATRVAALLSGEVDLIDPVPVQDVERIKATPAVQVLIGPEIRTIFLNMDSFRNELLYSSIKGRNPFKDVRVRKAFYQVIDIETIKTKVMRGMAVPSALLISPLLFASRAEVFKRHPYDVEAAKQLMADAGYGEGFELEMDCPNDRYVNDEAICQAVAQMLARINVKVKLNAQPKAKYFEKAGSLSKYNTSFSMLGWTPGSLDGWNVLANIMGCRDADGKGANNNQGGYCNPRIDELASQVLVETNTAKRDGLLAEAFRIVHDEAGILPLHQQSLVWGASKKVTVAQRADAHILFQWITKQD